MNNKTLLQIGLIIVLSVGGWLLFPHLQKPQSEIHVSDFSSCQMAGGEILQTDPIACKMPDGRTFEEEESAQPDVVLDTPKYGDLVKSPLTVTGKARGGWFFEAQLPVILKDSTGKELFHGPASAQSDWMTADYVPFSVTFPFDPADAEFGILLINKDNPSGDPDLDSSSAIPVRFK